MMNKKILYLIIFISFVAILTLVIRQKTATPSRSDFSETQLDYDSATSTPQTQSTAVSTPASFSGPFGGNSASESESTARQVNEKIKQYELERLKKLQKETTHDINAKMRNEEITGLRESIVNDEKLLKEIEASGTGADDYKYIENNLSKRKKRLHELQRASR